MIFFSAVVIRKEPPSCRKRTVRPEAALFLDTRLAYMSLLSLQFHPRGQNTNTQGKQQLDKENPTVRDAASILIGAIMSAINQYFKVRAGPSGVVCESLGNHYHGLCITSISQVSVNNLSFKN